MRTLSKRQIQEIKQDIKQERIQEEQQARQDSKFEEWFSFNKEDLIKDYIDNYDTEFMDYCIACYEAEEE